MADVFISYAKTNRTHAERLAAALTKEGWTVWWDPHIEPGDDFDEVIEAQLEAAPCVVVLWSEVSRKSRYVKGEARDAMVKGKLVPAFVEEVKPPIDFRSIQTVFLHEWEGDIQDAEYQKLVRRIARRVEEAGLRKSTPSSAPKSLMDATAERTSELAKERTTVPPRLVREPLFSFRDPLRDGGEGPEMVVIPAGHFWMGSPEDEPGRHGWDEGPRHRVEIPRSFALGRTAVTFEQYDRYRKATRRKRPDDHAFGRGNRPVINVSWNDAVAYANWLCKQSGRRYRLPTEAEWEYACRAGTETPFSTGDCINSDQANYNGKRGIYSDCRAKTRRFRGETVPTGSLPPNPWGLYEMHGNVWELVQDCWHASVGYSEAPTNAQAWEDAESKGCPQRVARGGAWGEHAGNLRSARRTPSLQKSRAAWVGFRLARDLDQ